jgi:S1-C subfamily serine protease
MKNKSKYLVIATVLVLAALSCQTLSGAPVQNLPAITQIVPLVTTIVETVEPPASQPAIPPALDLVSSQDLLVKLYGEVNPGVVAIRVLTDSGGGLGSGFVFDADGHIVTNYHVVENETSLEVAFPSGFKARGNVIGTDLDSDLAVVEVDAPKEELHPLKMGDSDQMQVGQTVVAIGDPFGLEGTMTVGIVSALGRTQSSLHTTSEGGTFSAGDIIQTDAAINPGNSGGPLLNLNGEVIGVNQAIQTDNFSSTGEPSNSGIGFAVSGNIVKRVVPFLIKDGKYDYPYLGITSKGSDLTLTEQEALGLPQSTGVYVTGVTAGGPAEKAGLQGGDSPSSIPGLQSGGDLIIAIDNQPVLTYNDLIGYLMKSKSPGDKVTLTVLRNGDKLNFDLTLDKRPAP